MAPHKGAICWECRGTLPIRSFKLRYSVDQFAGKSVKSSAAKNGQYAPVVSIRTDFADETHFHSLGRKHKIKGAILLVRSSLRPSAADATPSSISSMCRRVGLLSLKLVVLVRPQERSQKKPRVSYKLKHFRSLGS